MLSDTRSKLKILDLGAHHDFICNDYGAEHLHVAVDRSYLVKTGDDPRVVNAIRRELNVSENEARDLTQGEFAKKIGRKRGKLPSLLVAASAEHLPFSDRVFDETHARNVIQHIYNDKIKLGKSDSKIDREVDDLVAEVARVTKDKIIFSVSRVRLPEASGVPLMREIRDLFRVKLEKHGFMVKEHTNDFDYKMKKLYPNWHKAASSPARKSLNEIEKGAFILIATRI